MEQFNLDCEYNELHSRYSENAAKPIIGITANFNDGNACLAEAYYASILAAGGVPLLIPPYPDRDALLATLDSVDAILLSGGADIDPRYMSQEPDYSLLHTINPRRDEQELMLVRLADARQIPILGICRGIQTLAAALGGSVHQDIYAALGNGLLNHDQSEERGVATHEVLFVEGSRIARIFASERLAVNTFHHQAVLSVPEGFIVSAHATDGVIEGMEAVDGRSIIGVQWHPESFILKDGNRCMMPLFKWLVDEALLYRKAKEIHSEIVAVDSHCDTPMLFDGGYNFGERSSRALVDLHKMHEGGLDVATMAVYLRQEARDKESLSKAVEKTNRLLDAIENKVQQCSPYAAIATTPEEVLICKQQKKRVVMRAIENGYAIGDDISNIERYKRKGVVYMTLCHNGDNDICDSARGCGEHGGLSAFGREVVKEMNRVGMMIDLSHASETTFFDVIKYSSKPVVCSHSSCKALCNHPRNVTDEQMRAIASVGGVVQITMYNGFLVEDGNAMLDDFMRHLQHAIEVAGIEHVGIGTDFDGDGGIIGCADASQLRNITREMLRRGFTKDDIAAVWGGNWMRVMREIQQV